MVVTYISSSYTTLQNKQNKPNIQDLITTNKLIVTAQKTNDNGIRFCQEKFHFYDIILLSIIDASFGGEITGAEDGCKQGH